MGFAGSHPSHTVNRTNQSWSNLQNLKAQEILPKGELFHIQNSIQLGWLTKLPTITTRINDFWVEYEENRIHQFYSNLSIFDNFGNEQNQQTIFIWTRDWDNSKKIDQLIKIVEVLALASHISEIIIRRTLPLLAPRTAWMVNFILLYV